VELVRLGFERLGLRHRIHHAADGDAALDYLSSSTANPDLILLDLNLPKKHGLEVLKELKRSAALRRIPTVIYSSSRSPEDINRSYDLCANAYVPKPSGFAHLIDSLRTLQQFWGELAELPTP
jgi:CheY-like chemotaxis protein